MPHPPGEGQELKHQQVAPEGVSLLTSGVVVHGVRGVQDQGGPPVTVQDVREAGGVEVGQGAPGADRTGTAAERQGRMC